MARRRASMREGPLAELFRATVAAQRQAEKEGRTEEPETAASPVEPPEQTVEPVPEWMEEPAPPAPKPVRLPERKPEPEAKPTPPPAREPERTRLVPHPQ